MLSRWALTTLVHNKSQEKIIVRWGCRYCVVGFTPGDYSFRTTFPLHGQFNVAMTSSFVDGDEPIQKALEAARRLPKVNLCITGNSNLLPSLFLANISEVQASQTGNAKSGSFPYRLYLLSRDESI